MLDIGTNTWGSVQRLSQTRLSLGSTSVGRKLQLAGGTTGAAPGAVVGVCEPVGVNDCAPVASSIGLAATISASGSAGIASNSLVLDAVGPPIADFLFFHGPARVQLPFGNGYRCAAGSLVRLPIGLASKSRVRLPPSRSPAEEVESGRRGAAPAVVRECASPCPSEPAGGRLLNSA